MAKGYQLLIEVFDQVQGKPDATSAPYRAVFRGPVELGRQQNGREPTFRELAHPDIKGHRLVIAPLGEDMMSRRHAVIEPLEDERIRITNVSAAAPIRWPDETELLASESVEMISPTVIYLGRKRVHLCCVQDDGDPLFAESNPLYAVELKLDQVAVAKRLMEACPPIPADEAFNLAEALTLVVDRLPKAMSVIQADLLSKEHFSLAARSVVEIVGLDSGRVLFYEDGNWNTKGLYAAPNVRDDCQRQPCQSVLDKLMIQKRTFTKEPYQTSESESLFNIEQVVAAPILNTKNEVIGALYGERKRSPRGGYLELITPLQVKLMELLAMGLAGGLTRMDLQAKAAKPGVALEGAITEEVMVNAAGQATEFDSAKGDGR